MSWWGWPLLVRRILVGVGVFVLWTHLAPRRPRGQNRARAAPRGQSLWHLGSTGGFLPLLTRSPSVVFGQRGAMPADRRRAGVGGVGRDVSGRVAAPRRPRSRQRLRGSRGSRNRRVQ